MLDVYIIEQIRKREEERRRIHERPALELPLERDPRPHRPRAEDVKDEEDEGPRVIIIDL